jgi:integrase
LLSEKRRPFADDEVKRILDYKYIRKNEADGFRADVTWFIPISFYTGMRLNETSQIRLDDIKKVDEVWCFDLTGSDVKNESSRRLVPIAQYLLDMGLLNHVSNLKNNHKKYLFSQLREIRNKPGSAGWGDPISRWFKRTLLNNIGIDMDEEKRRKTTVVFHCVRHTMISTCVKKGVQKHLIKRIVGHAQDDQITLGVYADVNDISLSLLKQVIDENLIWHK